MKAWHGRRAVVLGLARQGKALARYLEGQGAEVVLSDIKPAAALQSELEELSDLQLTYALGGHPEGLLAGTDVLFLSGGVPADLPIVTKARAGGIMIANDAQLFLEQTPASVIGITGSAGKTTTTSLVGEMGRSGLDATQRQVWLGGNIGFPLINSLGEMRREDLAVMELSSFQLELMTCSPHYAAFLNLRPDHLDRHGDMESYRSAKARIIDFQQEKDAALLNCSDPSIWAMRDRVKGRLLAFGEELPPDQDGGVIESGKLILRLNGEQIEICASTDVSMRGPHNRLNVLAASVLAHAAGIPIDAIREVAQTFEGVPHRLERVRTMSGVTWYNDSIATTPDRAIAAINSFEKPVIVLAGGRDKDLDWSQFSNIVQDRVRVLILFGEAAGKIERAVRRVSTEVSELLIQTADDLQSAVEIAVEIVVPGDIVLLSPGGTSFDEFESYEARGEKFHSLVKAI